jgi:hypothetical protein
MAGMENKIKLLFSLTSLPNPRSVSRLGFDANQQPYHYYKPICFIWPKKQMSPTLVLDIAARRSTNQNRV